MIARTSLSKSVDNCETAKRVFCAGTGWQRTYGGIWTFGGSGGSTGWFRRDVGAFGAWQRQLKETSGGGARWAGPDQFLLIYVGLLDDNRIFKLLSGCFQHRPHARNSACRLFFRGFWNLTFLHHPRLCCRKVCARHSLVLIGGSSKLRMHNVHWQKFSRQVHFTQRFIY